MMINTIILELRIIRKRIDWGCGTVYLLASFLMVKEILFFFKRNTLVGMMLLLKTNTIDIPKDFKRTHITFGLSLVLFFYFKYFLLYSFAW